VGYSGDDECTTTKIEDDLYVASKTRHMKSPHNKFMFSPEDKVTYIGVDYARGIKCNQWYASGTEDQVVDGHTLTIKSKRNHWFSTKDWSDANCVTNSDSACAQYPVRIVSEGTVYNHTNGETSRFHDHYEYMSFIVGKPPLYLFDTSTVCSGAAALGKTLATSSMPGTTTYTSQAADTSSTMQSDKANLRSASNKNSDLNVASRGKSLGGGALFGIVIGALAAVVLVALVVRRSNRPHSRSFELMNDDATTAGDKSRRLKNVPVVQSGVLQTRNGPLSPSSPPSRNVQITDDPHLKTSLPTCPIAFDKNADQQFNNSV